MWNVELIDVPADGSCFFASIATAMNHCLMTWADNEYFAIKMNKYIEGYEKETKKDLYEITPEFVRYLCSINIDKCIFETYCEEAKDREDCGEEDVVKFDSIEEMSEHIFKTKCWADHATIRSFFNAFETKCSLVIFDDSYGGVVYFQKEWTEDKEMYICLQRCANHYRPMKLSCDDEDIPICMPRETMLKFANYIRENTECELHNVY